MVLGINFLILAAIIWVFRTVEEMKFRYDNYYEGWEKDA